MAFNGSRKKNENCDISIFFDTLEQRQTEEVIGLLVSAVLILIIISSNILMLLGSIKTQQKQKPSEKLYIFLSITDLLIGIFTVPLSIALQTRNEFTQNCIFSAFYVISHTFITISGYIVVLIAIYTAVAICFPLFYRRHNNTKAFVTMVILIVIAPVMFSVITIGYFTQHPSNPRRRSMIQLVSIIFSFTLAFVVCLYVVLLRLLHKKRRKNRLGTNPPPRYDAKAIKVLSQIWSCLLVTHTPFFITLIRKGMGGSASNGDDADYKLDSTWISAYYWTIRLLYCNSFLNAIIYIDKNRKIKDFYKHMICYKRNIRSVERPQKTSSISLHRKNRIGVANNNLTF